MKKEILLTGLGVLLCLFLTECKTIPQSITEDTTKRSTENRTVDNREALIEKYWKLIELNGENFERSETLKEPHIILKKENYAVTGNSGCNSFFGTYKLMAEKITFSQMASTKMACLNMEKEQQMLIMLHEIDGYTLSQNGKILSLLKGTNTMAKFEVVYLD